MLCQKTTYGPCRLLASLNSAWLHQKRNCRGKWNFDRHKDLDILSCHGIHYYSGQLLLSPIFWGGKTHRHIERMYVHGKTHRHTANNGWLLGWPGCHSKRQGSSRILGSVIGITLSSHREMWTVLIISISTFVAFRDHVSRKIIQVVSDNISTVAYLNHMSRTSHELNQIGTAIWTEAIHHHVSITCCHIAEKQHQTTSA